MYSCVLKLGDQFQAHQSHRFWKAVVALVSSLALLALASCTYKNGDTFFFKRYGTVDTVIGRMSLAKWLGVPISLGTDVDHIDFSKPTIFLPDEVVDASIQGSYFVRGSSVVVILAPTATCRFDYILIAIDRTDHYFARRIQPCDHDLLFASDVRGVVATEQGVPDPQLWFMSERGFAGPLRQTALESSPQYPEPARSQKGASQTAALTKHRHNIVHPKPKPTPASPSGATVASADLTQAHRLELVAQVAVKYSFSGGSASKAVPLCLADDAACAR